MYNKKPFNFINRLKSFVYAFNGLKIFFSNDHNAWLHVIAATLAILLGYLLCIDTYQWCLLVIAIGMVLVAEIINTSIELLTDMVSPEYNEKAKKVKDMAAGGVLLAAFVSVIIALYIFIPKF